MRKSLWLLSAGLMALSMPAYAQDPAPQTDTDDTATEPTQGGTASGAGGRGTTAPTKGRRSTTARSSPRS